MSAPEGGHGCPLPRPPRTWGVHMIRSLSAIFAVCVLLAGAAIFEHFYVSKAFEDFSTELTSLYEKADAQTANYEDARAVQTAWEARKERLQIFLPHNDVARVDNYLAETVRLVAEENYAPALPKLEALMHLAQTFPNAYRPTPANIF